MICLFAREAIAIHNCCTARQQTTTATALTSRMTQAIIHITCEKSYIFMQTDLTSLKSGY